LEAGAETNTQDFAGLTPLHEVADKEGGLEVLQLLLDHGADPNVPGGEDNVTPLHDAAALGCVEICRALVRKGASKAARDAHGNTPL
jgi:ankyrin repeat protein